MKIAIIGGMLPRPYYESDRILYEALNRGHKAIYLSKSHIIQTNAFGNFQIFFSPPTIEEQFNSAKNFKQGSLPIQIKPKQEKWGIQTKKSLLGLRPSKNINNWYNLLYFDAFIVREIGKTLDWSVNLVNYLLKNGKTVVDEKIGRQFYYTSKTGTFYKLSLNKLPYAKTFALVAKKELPRVLKMMRFPVVVKRSAGSKGIGIERFYKPEEVITFFKDSEHKMHEYLLQEFVDFKGDVRVFVVGDKILGGMRRTPKKGQWKGNVAQGAKATLYELDEKLKKLALDAVKLQKSEIVGVDIMLPKSGPIIIETNRAPQFQGFEGSTDVNVGKEIIKYVEQKHEKLND